MLHESGDIAEDVCPPGRAMHKGDHFFLRRLSTVDYANHYDTVINRHNTVLQQPRTGTT